MRLAKAILGVLSASLVTVILGCGGGGSDGTGAGSSTSASTTASGQTDSSSNPSSETGAAPAASTTITVDSRTGVSNVDQVNGRTGLNSKISEMLAVTRAQLNPTARASEAAAYPLRSDNRYQVSLVYDERDPRLALFDITPGPNARNVILLEFALFTTARLAYCVFVADQMQFGRGDCELKQKGGWSPQPILGRYSRDLFLWGGPSVLQLSTTRD